MIGLLPGVKLINHLKHEDERGNFCELWKSSNDNMRGAFRQVNIATSNYNVLRGMHRQNQSKLVMPIVGEIFDVALDPQTGDWCGIKLDKDTALFIPPYYAHGYLVLSEYSIVQYVVDSPYNKSEEENFKWNNYGIDWPETNFPPFLSAKDQ
jgi:dTDP-4-dehydrorhamnose 3,5-epimerase